MNIKFLPYAEVRYGYFLQNEQNNFFHCAIIINKNIIAIQIKLLFDKYICITKMQYVDNIKY